SPRVRWAALMAALVLAQGGPAIRAQQPPPSAPAYNPNATYGRPTSRTQGTAQLTTAPPVAPSVNVAGYAPPPASPAYAVPAVGYVPYYSSPMEGYLNGAANVTTANAQYQVTIQQARLLREQSYQASLETRRRTLEEH